MLWNKSLPGIALFMLIWLPFNVQGQDRNVIQIDLESVLRLCGADNLTIEEYRNKSELAQAEFVKTKEWWLPVLYGGATTYNLSGSAINTDGRIFTDVNRNNLNLEGNISLRSSESDMVPLSIVEDPDLIPAPEGYMKRPEYFGLQSGLKSIESENKLYSTALLLPSLRVGTYGSMFGKSLHDLNPTMELNTSLVWSIPLGRLVYAGDKKREEAKIMLQQSG